MKHLTRYELPYTHEVVVGIHVDSAEEARQKAEVLFDGGEIWVDTESVPLIRDDFEETGDSGDRPEFEILETLDDDTPFPPAGACVKRVREDDKARQAVRALLDAYAAGERNGGSIDWGDLDRACELAKQAMPYYKPAASDEPDVDDGPSP